MKVRVYADEWYPYYGMVDDQEIGVDIELTKKQLEELKRADKKITKIQKEIREIVERVGG